MRGLRLVIRHEFRLISTDPSVVAVLLVMPLVLIVFLKNGVVPPSADGSGSDQAVPGIAILFAYFIVAYTGFAFFREHGWNTWDRQRTMPISLGAIVFGKTVPYLVVGMLQIATLLVAGRIFLGMQFNGSPLAMAALVGAVVASAVSMAVMLVALTTSVQQMSTIANLAAVLLGGMGGALAPVSSFPAWADAIAHVTPQFWAIEAMRSIIVDGAGFVDVGVNIMVLVGFVVLFGGLALRAFDATVRKRSYA